MKITPPHKLISRPVMNEDLPRVIAEAQDMGSWISMNPCLALAHSQIEDKDPLSFYVTKEGEVRINPVITSHGRKTADGLEGCMTFPGKKHVMKTRYMAITVEYQKLKGNAPVPLISEKKSEMKLTGFPAVIAQHEIDHLNGRYCYDN